MIDVSIVSGTFNRLPFLQRMIDSVRQSLQGVRGLEVEVIVVDGGSEDGTLPWLRQQPGVRVIEHGELRGAVKAFNDGARAAQGEYVILANDDVEFVGRSLVNAWSYMVAHPECGMGCFYQDRDRQNAAEESKWRVEGQMVVVERGGEYVPAHAVYGQVCIVPRELGNRLGWWGDFLHTYGGDNELTSNVYEAGYRVTPVWWGDGPAPAHIARRELGACIHDAAPMDALRKINNVAGTSDPKAVGRRGARMHPDSYKWGNKWAKRWLNVKRGLAGPLVRETPQFPIAHQDRERILYLPIFEPGWEIQKRQKRGLREALAKVGVVREYDYAGRAQELGRESMLDELEMEVRQFRPSVCLWQVHGAATINAGDVARFRRVGGDAWWVCWNGDYWPENLMSADGIALAASFDLMTTVNRDAAESYWKLGVGARYWQIGWEPDGVGHEPEPSDRCDVVFLGNGYSGDRQKFVRRVKGLPYSLRLWGNGWPEGWAVGQCTYDFITACKAYRGARFSLGDSQWPESGFVSNRVFQALAAGGSALCHQWFRGMEELGLEDGSTCVVWKDFDDLARKLRRYAADEPERARIAANGQRLALERHSFDRRVEELWAWRPGAVEDWR